jgi:hypothetical protein
VPKVIMAKQPVSFDPETVSLLRETLDDAWGSLRPEQRAMTSRTLLAEGILKSAAKGERNPERLRHAAFTAIGPKALIAGDDAPQGLSGAH